MATSKVDAIYASMYDDNGEMRIMPGWEKVDRPNDIIGKDMPCVHRSVSIYHDNDDESLLWSVPGEDGKQIMLSIDDLLPPSGFEPLPSQTYEFVGKRTSPNGMVVPCKLFQPYPIYKVHKNSDEDKLCKRAREAASGVQEQGLRVDVFYPLFKVYEIMGLERVERQDATTTKKRKVNAWESGNWTRNDKGTADWDSTHPDGPKLIHGPDGYWHHPDYEIEYWTTLNMPYTESTINARKDLGLFKHDEEEYIWKLNAQAYDVQRYEADMEKKISRHNSSKEEVDVMEE